jgi:hypothetical protein
MPNGAEPFAQTDDPVWAFLLVDIGAAGRLA